MTGILPEITASPFVQNPWKRFNNASGETIPPFSVMRIINSSDVNGALTFSVGKPNSTEYDAYLVNGPFAVPVGKDGICTTLTQAGYVAYDTGTPALGEQWGPASGQWSLTSSGTGFFICGGTINSAGVDAVAAIQISSGDKVDIVQVFHSTGTAGYIMQPNASNVHPGRVKRWNGTTMATAEDCWIGFVDDYDNNLGDVLSFDGEYYGPARRSGLFTVDGDERPLYVVSINEESFFGITRDALAQGGTVDVDVYAYVGAQWRSMALIITDCVDWYLNEGESIERGTKVEVKRYGAVWVVAGAYCSPTDLAELQASYSPSREDFAWTPPYDVALGSVSYSVSYDAGGGFSSGGGYFNWD